MLTESSAMTAPTGYALFDDRDVLVDANAEIFDRDTPHHDLAATDLAALSAAVLSGLRSFDGRSVEQSDDFIRSAALRWKQTGQAPVEAETVDGRWKLLTAHPRSEGGIALVSVDITEIKKAQIAYQINSEIFRSITDSHPLPVWVVDEERKEILYESLDASNLLGRKWRADEPQFITDQLELSELEKISKLLDERDIVRDHEIQLTQSDGTTVWCSANCRRGVYQERPSLIIGVLDITQRKQREDLFGFLIKHHPLPVWMNEVESGNLVYQSRAAERMFGWPRNTTRKMPRLCDYFVDQRQYREIRRELLKKGSVENCEALLKRADGQEIWATGNLRVVEFQGRQMVLGGIADVTKQKKRDDEIALARKKAEAAERDAHALLRQVLDACPSPTRMSTIDGQSLYRNPACADLYGDRDRITDYYVYAEDSRRLVGTLLEDGRVDDFRVRQYTADNRVFWASLSARLIDFQGRQVIVSNTTNIDDLILAQQQTRRANERLIDAIESLAEGFALYGKDDGLILANSRYRKMHAISADVLTPGVNWFDFLRVTAERNQFPVPAAGIDSWLAERAKDRREFRQQEFQHTDGSWYFVSTCPTREGGFVVTRVDISERKRAELAAKEADELVRKVLEACPVNIQMTRAHDGKVLYRSPATAALLGDVAYAADYYVDQSDRKRYIKQLLNEGTVDEFETQLKRRDGGTCWCSISSRLIDFHGENVIVSHAYDLTDRMRMQTELERQRETLHQNEKLSALGELLAGVAHELNNPLSVVLGLSLIMKETAKDPTTEERADKIGKAAERCARIVKTFLAMARQQPTQTLNIGIDDVIASAIEVAGYSIRSSDVALSVHFQKGLPRIWADPDQLSQVLTNLLVNAEQALHGWEGQREIAVSTHLHPRNGNVIVRIADTGPGIAMEILPRIFEPFFTTKEIGAGTGIGLSFCHRIVQSHGGTIEVETVSGKGSTFVVSLPTSSRIDANVEIKPDQPVKSNGLACLVVDDEKDVGDLIAEVLRRDGFKVTVARSGEEALRHLRKRTFALILSDLKMPNMDGRHLFNHVADFHPAEIDRLAFLTGDTISPDAQLFLRATKRPYLEKPIKPDELRSFVSKLMSKEV